MSRLDGISRISEKSFRFEIVLLRAEVCLSESWLLNDVVGMHIYNKAVFVPGVK